MDMERKEWKWAEEVMDGIYEELEEQPMQEWLEKGLGVPLIDVSELGAMICGGVVQNPEERGIDSEEVARIAIRGIVAGMWLGRRMQRTN
jgi:hypothetical protein